MNVLNDSMKPKILLKLRPSDREAIKGMVSQADDAIAERQKYESLRDEIEKEVRQNNPSPTPTIEGHMGFACAPISDVREETMGRANSEARARQHKDYERELRRQTAESLSRACKEQGIHIPTLEKPSPQAILKRFGK